jgi:hypothetical protein
MNNTSTDTFRSLCEKLTDAYEHELNKRGMGCGLIDRARAALSQPEPGVPTFIEVMQLADDFFTFRGNSHGGAFFATEITAKTDPGQALEQFAHAVLTRWGRLSIEPVPVSERLPKPEDCDAEGRCWWWIVDQPGEFPHWIHAPIEAQSWAGYSATHKLVLVHRGRIGLAVWLPHHALPVPTTRKDD